MASEVRLGEAPPADAGRDALHIAVVPVIAAEPMLPGTRVRFTAGSTVMVEPAEVNPLGILDPFLPHGVDEGDRVWLCLFPYTITGLHHVWTHPAFPTETPMRRPEQVGASETWLRRYAAQLGLSLAGLIDGARDYLNTGNGLYVDESYAYEIDPNFWSHYQIFTGEAVPDEQQQAFFRCAC